MNVRLLLRSLAFGFATSACLLIGTGFGSAQSPSPTNTFGNVAPGVTSVPSGSSGIVVEGLGGGACYYSASSVETSTVYWLDNYWPTWTEISPQAGCKTVAGYESEVDAIVYDVEHSGAPSIGSNWLGIMVDEESAYGFTPSQLETLNEYIASSLSSTPGITWWATENFSGAGDWSQAEFDSITYNSAPADQISTSYMVSLTNGLGAGGVLVTWWSGSSYPYDLESYDDGAISGVPWVHYIGSDAFYFDNQFIS